MAAYATVAEVFERVSRDDLAERAAPNDPAVDGTLLSSWVADRDAGAAAISGRPDAVDLTAALDRAVARIGRGLADAAARINGYIAARYPDASAAPGDTLRVLSLDIFLFEFFGDTDGYQERYDAALAFLRRIADGRADLPLDPADAGGVSGAAEVLSTSADEIFSRRSTAGYLEGV